MKDELFNELLESVKEGSAILRDNLRTGSSFDDWLKEEGIYDEVTAATLLFWDSKDDEEIRQWFDEHVTRFHFDEYVKRVEKRSRMFGMCDKIRKYHRMAWNPAYAERVWDQRWSRTFAKRASQRFLARRLNISPEFVALVERNFSERPDLWPE